MNIFQRLGLALAGKAATAPRRVPLGDRWMVGENTVMYAPDSGVSYIEKGYNRNAQVYSIVSKNARKLAQVPLYHVRVKRNERKTWETYQIQTKNGIHPENVKELRKMRTKAIEENVVDSDLSKLLAKPNRNQTGARFVEQLRGFNQLTGEGNIWMPRGEDGKQKPSELFIIPKQFLQLVTGSDPWDIAGFKIDLFKGQRTFNRDEVIMWIQEGYNMDVNSLAHLRGQSPLDAGLLTMQASNEGAERLVKMNKNQGASGMLYRTDQAGADPDAITPAQALMLRAQVNNAVNQKDMAGAIAYLTGQYGYLQFGLDADKLRLIEQVNASFDTLCNIFDIPPGIFAKDQTYENAKEIYRSWIFSNIAPAAYSLRDELNEKLILAMELDRERDFIDCDVLALPEMAADLGKQISALKDAWWLTVDEKRTYSGYEPFNTEDTNRIYVPTGFTTFDEINQPTTGTAQQRQEEEDLLND